MFGRYLLMKTMVYVSFVLVWGCSEDGLKENETTALNKDMAPDVLDADLPDLGKSQNQQGCDIFRAVEVEARKQVLSCSEYVQTWGMSYSRGGFDTSTRAALGEGVHQARVMEVSTNHAVLAINEEQSYTFEWGGAPLQDWLEVEQKVLIKSERAGLFGVYSWIITEQANLIAGSPHSFSANEKTLTFYKDRFEVDWEEKCVENGSRTYDLKLNEAILSRGQTLKIEDKWIVTFLDAIGVDRTDDGTRIGEPIFYARIDLIEMHQSCRKKMP